MIQDIIKGVITYVILNAQPDSSLTIPIKYARIVRTTATHAIKTLLVSVATQLLIKDKLTIQLRDVFPLEDITRVMYQLVLSAPSYVQVVHQYTNVIPAHPITTSGVIICAMLFV